MSAPPRGGRHGHDRQAATRRFRADSVSQAEAALVDGRRRSRMIHYVDTSALAKRYVEERGSKAVRALVHPSRIAVARVTYAELLATLARAGREGLITAEQRDVLFDRAER